MSAAPSTVLLTTPHESVAVVGGAPGPGREAQRLLRAAGFTAERLGALQELARERTPGLVLLFAGAAEKPAELIAGAAREAPGAPVVLVLPHDAGGTALRRALRAGAAGLILDDALARALVPTLRAVAAGLLVVPPAARRHLAPRALSYKEKQILRLVVEGYTNRQIADALFVAESTVKTHLSSAFGKLDTRSRAEAAALVMDPEEGAGLGILGNSPSAEDPATGRR